jgi:hypothetical protein
MSHYQKVEGDAIPRGLFRERMSYVANTAVSQRRGLAGSSLPGSATAFPMRLDRSRMSISYSRKLVQRPALSWDLLLLTSASGPSSKERVSGFVQRTKQA